MRVIKLDLKDLPGRLAKTAKESKDVLRRGIKAGADDAASVLRRNTPVDTGELRDAWEVVEHDDGIELVNNAPHAGIIEMGAKPHPVSIEGQEALAEWAIRRLNVDPSEAKRVAYAIATKMLREGQKPTYFVRMSFDEVVREIHRRVEDEFKQYAGGG